MNIFTYKNSLEKKFPCHLGGIFSIYDLGIDLPYLEDIVWVVFVVYGTLHFMCGPGDLKHIELEIFDSISVEIATVMSWNDRY